MIDRNWWRWRCWLAGVLLLSPLAGCSSEEEDEEECQPISVDYSVNLDPASFVAAVDHPLFPLSPGATWHYEGGGESIDVAVLTETRQVVGITATVVRDTVTVNGAVVEDTYDWYAQHSDGTVWYLGEDSTSYEDGEVSKEGSWEAGVDGAMPGIVMQATPAVGDRYRQEFLVCEAEDEAEVVALDESVTVPGGSFTGCLMTREWTRLEPDVNENKLYAAGLGLVLEVDVNTGQRVELISSTP